MKNIRLFASLVLFATILMSCKKEEVKPLEDGTNYVIINNVTYPIREMEMNYHPENDDMSLEIYPNSPTEMEIEVELFKWSERVDFTFDSGGSYENGDNMFAFSYETMYNESYQKYCSGTMEVLEYVQGEFVSGKGSVIIDKDTISFNFDMKELKSPPITKVDGTETSVVQE